MRDPVLLTALEVAPLSVPTVDPFVIASGEVRATRSVLVTATLTAVDATKQATGLGEGACLPPVTREDQPDALHAVNEAAPRLINQRFDSLDQLETVLLQALPQHPVARAGIEMALLDAWSQLDGQPLFCWLGGPKEAPPVETDITIPILAPARMAELATQWWSQGFRKLKVKAGRSLADDLQRLEAISKVTPQATFQPDANGGLSVEQALAWLEAAEKLGVRVTCFEQPCATLPELTVLASRTSVPVLADESVIAVGQLDGATGIGGVNLKIAKSGGLLAARRIGLRAQQMRLKVMVGGMVETRLGMTAATHLAASLDGVDFADLDTAWLLADDPFRGGYQADGPHYRLPATAGLGISLR